MHNQIESYASDQMNKSIYLYNKTGQETYTKAWDVLQSDVSIFWYIKLFKVQLSETKL